MCLTWDALSNLFPRALINTRMHARAMSTPCANVTTSVVLSLARADALARRHERELSAPLRSRFVELLLALGGNGTVNVIVIGGSIPAARMCVRTGASGLWASKYVCSYPSRFARWLAAAHCRDRSAVNFVNRASGGSTTAGWLPSLPSVPLQNERPDGLLLIDFAMNDKFDGVDFSRNESNQVVSTSPVAAATEVMLRFLLAHTQLSPVLVEGTCAEGNAPSRNAHATIARRYGVPFVPYHALLETPYAHHCGKHSYRAATPGTTAWQCKDQNCVHPAPGTYELISAGLGLWWSAFERALSPSVESPAGGRDRHFHLSVTSSPSPSPLSLPSPLTAPSLRQRYYVCRSHTATYDARAAMGCTHAQGSWAGEQAVERVGCAGSLFPRVEAGAWPLVSAREDKPAWVTEGPEHSQLAFDLLFGAALRLTVVYDVSYRDFGLVSLKLAYHAPRWPAEMISRLPTGPFQLSGTAEASHNVTQTGVFSLNLKLSLQSDGQPAETPFGRMASRAASSALITQVPSLPLNATLVLTSLSKPPLRFQVRQVTAC